MVHAAVYDAVVAIDGRFQPYHVVILGANGSPAAATAKAAHDILVNRFPGQAASVDNAYHDYLAKNGLSESDPGVEVGQKAAAGIIAPAGKRWKLPESATAALYWRNRARRMASHSFVPTWAGGGFDQRQIYESVRRG
jgi:hypothetical protein